MSLREFRDHAGVEWKVWDITPDRMHPVTAREMFVGRYVDFQEGWLVFESDAERRRLAPYPVQWADFAVAELETLLNMATPSPSRLRGETSGSFRRIEERGASAEDAAAVPPPAAAAAGTTFEQPPAAAGAPPRALGEWREFVGPSGRRWTVTLANRGVAADASFGPDARRLLRFAADDGTVCDLETWPEDWQRFTSAQLMELLRRAEPSREAGAGRHPRRRREDREP